MTTVSRQAGVATATEDGLADLRSWDGSRILVTGGTGFLGSWLCDVLLAAEKHCGAVVSVAIVSRDASRVPERFVRHPRVEFIESDVRQLKSVGQVDGVFHAATSSSASFDPREGDGSPLTVVDTVIGGTQAVLSLCQSRTRVVLLGSGAVYGVSKRPVAEADDVTAPTPMRSTSAYANAKRLAETMGASATDAGTAQVVAARIFSVLGPGLPVDVHFAAGNFARDAAAGRDIRVAGNGRPMRSYLHPADVVVWLLALLSRGRPATAYNVGSPDPITILDLARRFGAVVGSPVTVERSSDCAEGEVYVPVVDRITSELGVGIRWGLDESIRSLIDHVRDSGTA